MFGGGVTSTGNINRVDIFNSTTGVWGSASLGQARSLLAATVLGSRAYFGGGTAAVAQVPTNWVDVYST